MDALARIFEVIVLSLTTVTVLAEVGFIGLDVLAERKALRRQPRGFKTPSEAVRAVPANELSNDRLAA